MSHGKKHRKRKKPSRTVCARCLTVSGGSAASLLGGVAAALNACADAGMPVRLRHGIVVAHGGYVLPLAGGRWTARALSYDPLEAGETEPGSDDD